MLAEAFHFQPSELGVLTGPDIRFWVDRMNEMVKRRKG